MAIDATSITLAIGLFFLFILIAWRFSLLVGKLIEAYQDDKQIDREEFIMLYNETLSFFRWVLALFGVNVTVLAPDVEANV